MKKRKVICRLRTVLEVMVISLLAVIVLWGVYNPHQEELNKLLSMWPFGAGLTFAYALLTCIDDYLNNRILSHYPKLP